jgi:LuxR family maltose regulon positive regulatory protein
MRQLDEVRHAEKARRPLPAGRRLGDAALRRGDWSAARDAFASALKIEESPEAFEGLGLAAWWLDLADEVFASRERAYRLFVERDDRPGAARVAVWMAWDCCAFRGETAIANGWLQRARRLLEGLPACSERAWLEVREGAFALLEEGEPDRACDLSARGLSVAQEVGSKDLEMVARALQGLAMVATGAVAAGMRDLDEVNAAMLAGEMTDRVAIGLAGCYMVAACDRMHDYERAVQWCERMKLFSASWGFRALIAKCRAQYASLCLWRGLWSEAEEELAAAIEELAACRPAMAAEGTARLAELRRRQGRLDEAERLFAGAEPHRLARLGQAALAFDRGDLDGAAEQAERYLRRVAAANRTDRVAGLDLLVRARALAGDVDGARTALAELDAIAAFAGTASMRAAARLAAGRVALAAGDAAAAQRCCEDAIDLFRACGAPYELAGAHLELANAQAARGRGSAAVQEARRAIELLQQLRAELELSRAEALIERLSRPRQEPPAAQHDPAPGLTRREVEVLRLIAADLNSRLIATRLSLSEHTVHRHIANIFHKLGVSSRAAAVAQGARRHLLG